MLGQYLGSGASTTKLLLHLNGNSNDSSGNGNNATGTAITYSQSNGKFGQGASLNGSSSNFYIGMPIPSDKYTVSFWVNPLSTGSYALITKDYYRSGENQRCLSPDIVNGLLTWYMWTTTRTAYDNPYYTTAQLEIGVKQLVVVVFDSSINKLIIYVNGSKKSETNTTGTQLDIPYDLKIGVRNFVSSPNYLYGYLDEIIFENIAWSDSYRIKNHTYSKGRFGIL